MRIGDRATLELTGLEETLDDDAESMQDAEPMLDLHQRVFIAGLFGDQIGPAALLSIVPGVVGEERDLARAVAEGKDAA